MKHVIQSPTRGLLASIAWSTKNCEFLLERVSVAIEAGHKKMAENLFLLRIILRPDRAQHRRMRFTEPQHSSAS